MVGYSPSSKGGTDYSHAPLRGLNFETRANS